MNTAEFFAAVVSSESVIHLAKVIGTEFSVMQISNKHERASEQTNRGNFLFYRSFYVEVFRCLPFIYSAFVCNCVCNSVCPIFDFIMQARYHRHSIHDVRNKYAVDNILACLCVKQRHLAEPHYACFSAQPDDFLYCSCKATYSP